MIKHVFVRGDVVGQVKLVAGPTNRFVVDKVYTTGNLSNPRIFLEGYPNYHFFASELFLIESAAPEKIEKTAPTPVLIKQFLEVRFKGAEFKNSANVTILDVDPDEDDLNLLEIDCVQVTLDEVEHLAKSLLQIVEFQRDALAEQNA